MRIWACLALLWMLGPGARADSLAELQDRPVTAIRLEGQGLSESELQSVIDFKVGDRFSISAVRRSVRLLYHLGLFGQVRVQAVSGKEGVEVTFQLEPQRRVLAIDFIGNQAASDGELLRLSRMFRGDEFDRWKLDAATADMLGLYRRRGYRRTQLVTKLLGPEDGDVRIQIFIQEGPATRVSKLWFKGQLVFKPEELEGAMSLKEGDVLDEDRLLISLERLQAFYRKHGYLEVKVVPPPIDPGLLALWEVVPIEITAGAKVSFQFRGNDALSNRALRSEINLGKEIKLGREIQLHESALRDLADHLEEVYRKQGYAKVKVRPEVRLSPGGDRKTITFIVEEGPRVSVRRISFYGNRAFPDDQLREIVEDALFDAIPQSILGQPIDRGDVDIFGGNQPLRGEKRVPNRPEGFWFEIVPARVFLREAYDRALVQIGDLYQSQGYLSAQVGTPLLSYDTTGSNLYVTIDIEEGQQTRIESISFEGNGSVPAEKLLHLAEEQAASVRPGGPLNPTAVEELRKAMARVYARKGYVYCQVTQKLVFSTDRSIAALQFVFNEGPRVKVRRVLVRGNVVTERSVFDHMLSLRPGKIYSPDKAYNSQEDLLNLGIFSGVDIKMLDADVPEAEKDVVVFVRERLPQAITFMPGIASADGIRLEVDYSHLNLFGYAVELVAKAKVNRPVFYPLLPQALQSRYQNMPFLEGLEGWVVTGLHWPQVLFMQKGVAARLDLMGLQNHAESYDLTKISLTPGLDFNFGSGLALTTQFEFEYITLNCVLSDQPCGVETGEQWLRYDRGTMFLGSFQPAISWDRRDNPFRPHRGFLLSLRPELDKSLSPDRPAFFVKLDGLASVYIPLGHEVTLALSGRAGAILHLTADSITPSNKLFFLGGRNTVRSYKEDNLIPQDLNPPCIIRPGSTTPVCMSLGGNAYLNFKGEFRFPLIPEKLEGALFTDFGNLWLWTSDINPLQLRAAAGFGVRLVTPIGPVALDVGFNLAPDSSRHEDLWNLHFNIGEF